MSRYKLSSELQERLKEGASMVAGLAVAAGTFYVMQEYGLSQQAAEFMYPENNSESYMTVQSARHAAEFGISSFGAAFTGLSTYALSKFDK